VIAGFAYPGGVDPSFCLLGFDASEYLGRAAAGVFDDAEPAVAAWREQVSDSTPGMEPVTPQVLAWLSHAEHSEGLIHEREQGALLDDYFRGPRRIQDITRKLGGRHAELPQGQRCRHDRRAPPRERRRTLSRPNMVREPLHLQIHDVRCRTHRITRLWRAKLEQST